jgi:hypothetical protein
MNEKQDSAELKGKVQVVKDNMKSKGHTQIIPIYKFLYQDSDEKHLTKLQNVLQLKVTDKGITNRLEDISDQV